MKIIGIVGRLETPKEEKGQEKREKGGLTQKERDRFAEITGHEPEGSGLQNLVGRLETRIKGKERKNNDISHKVYGSSDGIDYVTPGGRAFATEESTEAKEIAKEMMDEVTAASDDGKLDGANVYRIALLAHSWGADKAIEVLEEFRELLAAAIQEKPEELEGKVQIEFFPMDAINRDPMPGREGEPTPAEDMPASDEIMGVYNIFETDDQPWPAGAALRFQASMALPGAAYPALGIDNNKDLTKDLNRDKSTHHEFLPKAALPYILEVLGLRGRRN